MDDNDEKMFNNKKLKTFKIQEIYFMILFFVLICSQVWENFNLQNSMKNSDWISVSDSLLFVFFIWNK
jgi:hypothetical protein